MNTRHTATRRLNRTVRFQDLFLRGSLQAFFEEHFVIDLGPQAETKNAAGGKVFPFDQRHRWLSGPEIDPIDLEAEFFDLEVKMYGEQHHTEVMRDGCYDLAPYQLAQLVVANPGLLDNGDKLCVGIVFSPYSNEGEFVLIYKEEEVVHLKVVTQPEASKMGPLVLVAAKLQ